MDEEESLTRKFAEGGMTPSRPNSLRMLRRERRHISAFWDEWAKSKGPDAVEALKKVRAALGR